MAFSLVVMLLLENISFLSLPIPTDAEAMRRLTSHSLDGTIVINEADHSHNHEFFSFQSNTILL